MVYGGKISIVGALGLEPSCRGATALQAASVILTVNAPLAFVRRGRLVSNQVVRVASLPRATSASTAGNRPATARLREQEPQDDWGDRWDLHPLRRGSRPRASTTSASTTVRLQGIEPCPIAYRAIARPSCYRREARQMIASSRSRRRWDRRPDSNRRPLE